jgi:hypothetical protein
MCNITNIDGIQVMLEKGMLEEKLLKLLMEKVWF